MNDEMHELHILRLRSTKLEIAFNLLIGVGLAIFGSIFGAWLSLIVLNWYMIVSGVLAWTALTGFLIKIKLDVMTAIFNQEIRVERARDMEAVFRDKGS